MHMDLPVSWNPSCISEYVAPLGGEEPIRPSKQLLVYVGSKRDSVGLVIKDLVLPCYTMVLPTR